MRAVEADAMSKVAYAPTSRKVMQPPDVPPTVEVLWSGVVSGLFGVRMTFRNVGEAKQTHIMTLLPPCFAIEVSFSSSHSRFFEIF